LKTRDDELIGLRARVAQLTQVTESQSTQVNQLKDQLVLKAKECASLSGRMHSLEEHQAEFDSRYHRLREENSRVMLETRRVEADLVHERRGNSHLKQQVDGYIRALAEGEAKQVLLVYQSEQAREELIKEHAKQLTAVKEAAREDLDNAQRRFEAELIRVKRKSTTTSLVVKRMKLTGRASRAALANRTSRTRPARHG
jgi:chromosome segregation ATPase